MINITKINDKNFWQTPAITELHAANKIQDISTNEERSFEYIAFPWATLIDFLQTGKKVPAALIDEYKNIKNREKFAKKVVTVCQHIYCYRYINIFKEAGVTDIFWSHTKFSDTTDPVINVHAFPLYPVIVPEESHVATIERDILYSFVGAYDQRYYQTDIRRRIFDSKDDTCKRIIIERKEWHYNSHVYKSQLGGEDVEKKLTEDIKERETEYRELLRRSIFSLCPSGSGPNSIRLWESLAYESIPVIFKDNICLPGTYSEWREAALFFSENQEGVDSCIKILGQLKENPTKLARMRECGKLLYEKFGRENFVYDIKKLVQYEESRIASKPIGEHKPKEKKYLLIVDPGLKDSGSHHHHVNADINNRFKGRAEVIVLGNKKLKQTAEMAYLAINNFTYSVYDFKYENIGKINHQAVVFSREISSAMTDFKKSGVIYIHTCTLPLLLGLSLAINEIVDRIDSIYIELMFLPQGHESINYNDKNTRFLEYFYSQAIEKLSKIMKERGRPFNIATSNKQFKSIYEKIFAKKNIKTLNINVHPHVMLTNESFNDIKFSRNQSMELSARVLMHAGDPRPGKGLRWIRNNIRKLIDEAPARTEFVCHINKIRFPKDYPDVVADVEWLEIFSSKNPNFVVKRDYIEIEEWYKFLSHFDYFIIPNEVSHYKNKTSGVVMDAVFSLGDAERIFVFEETLMYKIMQEEDFNVSKIEAIFDHVGNFSVRSPAGESQTMKNSSLFRESHVDYVETQLRIS